MIALEIQWFLFLINSRHNLDIVGSTLALQLDYRFDNNEYRVVHDVEFALYQKQQVCCNCYHLALLASLYLN